MWMNPREMIMCFQLVRSEETEQIDYMMIVFKQSIIVGGLQ
jgi:hypothetical protein